MLAIPLRGYTPWSTLRRHRWRAACPPREGNGPPSEPHPARGRAPGIYRDAGRGARNARRRRMCRYETLTRDGRFVGELGTESPARVALQLIAIALRMLRDGLEEG